MELTKSEQPNYEQLIQLVTRTVDSHYAKRDYARELRWYFDWHLASGNTMGFCRQSVLAYRETMLAKGRGPISINKALSAIRSLAREAAGVGAIEGAESSLIATIPFAKREGSRMGVWLSLDELRTLVAAKAPTTPNRALRDRAALLTMSTCGLRRQEVADLRLSHLRKVDGQMVFANFMGKGKKVRTVKVHDLAAAALQTWLDHAGITGDDAVLLPRIDNPDRISKKPTSGEALRNACVRYCTAVGMTFRPHDLRRTFATLTRKGGADYEEIRQALGHASLQTTVIYLRQSTALESPAADKLVL